MELWFPSSFKMLPVFSHASHRLMNADPLLVLFQTSSSTAPSMPSAPLPSSMLEDGIEEYSTLSAPTLARRGILPPFEFQESPLMCVRAYRFHPHFSRDGDSMALVRYTPFLLPLPLCRPSASLLLLCFPVFARVSTRYSFRSSRLPRAIRWTHSYRCAGRSCWGYDTRFAVNVSASPPRLQVSGKGCTNKDCKFQHSREFVPTLEAVEAVTLGIADSLGFQPEDAAVCCGSSALRFLTLCSNEFHVLCTQVAVGLDPPST